MTFLFNNSRNRRHGRYGVGAFYELDLSGCQAALPPRIRPGDTCIVASVADDGLVVFDWYSFAHEKWMLNEGGGLVRVLFGRIRKSQGLTRPRAAATQPYAHLFDRHGHFKAASILRIDDADAPARRAQPSGNSARTPSSPTKSSA